MNNKFFLIIAGIFGYVAYQKYFLSKNVKVNFNNLSINWNYVLKPVANIVLSIENPTNVSADIQNITGKLFLQNTEIGKIENLKVVKKISGNQTTNFDFNMDLDTFGIGVALLSTNLKNEIINFDGVIKIDFVNIPLRFQYKIL